MKITKLQARCLVYLLKGQAHYLKVAGGLFEQRDAEGGIPLSIRSQVARSLTKLACHGLIIKGDRNILTTLGYQVARTLGALGRFGPVKIGLTIEPEKTILRNLQKGPLDDPTQRSDHPP